MSASDPAAIKYGFYDRLKAEFPSQIIVDVTEICNLACTHCPHPEFRRSEYYSGAYLPEELNTKVIDEVAVAGRGHTQYVRYTSEGEPLIHPKAFSMLRYAKERSGTTVTLTTNGTLLRPKQIEQLLETGIDLVDISIDAFLGETYKNIRVGGDLAVTRAHVLDLIRRRSAAGSKMKIVVSYIEQPNNAAETLDFQKFWKAHGADYVVIRQLHSAAGAKTEVKETMLRGRSAIPRRPCVYPWERALLQPSGFIFFCPADWNRGSSVVDYRTTTLQELWRGEFYRKLRQAHLDNDFKDHAFCGQCPDWMLTGWPGRSRGYADMVQDFQRADGDRLV